MTITQKSDQCEVEQAKEEVDIKRRGEKMRLEYGWVAICEVVYVSGDVFHRVDTIAMLEFIYFKYTNSP